MYQSVASGKALDKSLLVKDVPKKHKDDIDYIMFVNRDYRNEQYISVEFKRHVDKLEVLDKKTGKWLDNRVRDYNTIIPQIWSIPPGDGIIVRVERSWLSTPERGRSKDPKIHGE